MIIALLYRDVERIQKVMYLKHLVSGSHTPSSLKQQQKSMTTTLGSDNRGCLELFGAGGCQGMIFLCIL